MNREPTGNTCGDIDAIIRTMNKVLELSDYVPDDPDDFAVQMNDINDEISGGESSLEDLRTANSKLREWGNDEAKEVDRLEEEIIDLKNEIMDVQEFL